MIGGPFPDPDFKTQVVEAAVDRRRELQDSERFKMTVSGSDFCQTRLWQEAFEEPREGSTADEQEYFRSQYQLVREQVTHLVSRISADMPGLTVHDIEHLDALWEIASLVTEDTVNLNPAEAFVLGTSILLHDAAMSVAAYPNGLPAIKETTIWKDTVARLALASEDK